MKESYLNIIPFLSRRVGYSFVCERLTIFSSLQALKIQYLRLIHNFCDRDSCNRSNKQLLLVPSASKVPQPVFLGCNCVLYCQRQEVQPWLLLANSSLVLKYLYACLWSGELFLLEQKQWEQGIGWPYGEDFEDISERARWLSLSVHTSLKTALYCLAFSMIVVGSNFQVVHLQVLACFMCGSLSARCGS